MAFGLPPTSEAGLLQRRPSSDRPGAFPREYLLAQERVLFETRPSLVHLYGGRLALLVVWCLFLVAAALTPAGQQDPSFWVFAGLVGFLPLGLTMVAGYRYSYAITTERVLACHGLVFRSVASARIAEIQNLLVGGGLTDKFRFVVVGPPGLRAGGSWLHPPRAVVWKSVTQAPQVYAYLQDVFRFLMPRWLPPQPPPLTSSQDLPPQSPLPPVSPFPTATPTPRGADMDLAAPSDGVAWIPPQLNLPGLTRVDPSADTIPPERSVLARPPYAASPPVASGSDPPAGQRAASSARIARPGPPTADPTTCPTCHRPLPAGAYAFCPFCWTRLP